MAQRGVIFWDDRELKGYLRDLKQFKAKALPFATKGLVNTAAFQTRVEAKKNIKKQMTLRNANTLRGIQVEQARTLQIKKQAAAVGSLDQYMEGQEFGRTDRSKGKHGIPIPTPTATGEGEAARPRRRLPTKPNKLKNIQLSRRRGRAANRKQRNMVAVQQAIKTKRKYVFLDTQKFPGIYRVTGRKKNPRVKLVHNMARRTVKIPPNPWLLPATDRVIPRLPGIFKKQLKRQLIRHKIRWGL